MFVPGERCEQSPEKILFGMGSYPLSHEVIKLQQQAHVCCEGNRRLAPLTYGFNGLCGNPKMPHKDEKAGETEASLALLFTRLLTLLNGAKHPVNDRLTRPRVLFRRAKYPKCPRSIKAWRDKSNIRRDTYTAERGAKHPVKCR